MAKSLERAPACPAEKQASQAGSSFCTKVRMLICAIFFFNGYILFLQLPLMWQWWKETFETTICSLLPCGEFTWLFTQLLLWTTKTLCPFGKWELSTLGVSSLKQAIKYSLKFTRLGVVIQEATTNISTLIQCSLVPWISHTPLCYEMRGARDLSFPAGKFLPLPRCPSSGQAVLLLSTAKTSA